MYDPSTGLVSPCLSRDSFPTQGRWSAIQLSPGTGSSFSSLFPGQQSSLFILSFMRIPVNGGEESPYSFTVYSNRSDTQSTGFFKINHYLISDHPVFLPPIFLPIFPPFIFPSLLSLYFLFLGLSSVTVSSILIGINFLWQALCFSKSLRIYL